MKELEKYSDYQIVQEIIRRGGIAVKITSVKVESSFNGICFDDVICNAKKKELKSKGKNVI